MGGVPGADIPATFLFRSGGASLIEINQVTSEPKQT